MGMDNYLLKLRQEVYDAASEYHSAVSDRLRVRSNTNAAHIEKVMRRLQETAGKYDNALNGLITHLDTLGESAESTKELERVRSARAVLERESKLMR
jgi:hypothetical protein